MYKKIAVKLLPIFAFLLSGCGAYFNQPYEPQDARIGELTAKTQVLRELPVPYEKVVVGVYNFKDQTGQYKTLEAGSSFSTAVSQGATTMLVQALEDSKWFTPIERENLNNLLNERNIIRSTREEYQKNSNSSQPFLPPLLYAGILLEGGVVSYDTNIITGGAGARYFGAGASTKYRQDRITIYLRAVSTSNGEILKTVYVSKTILSQSIDASLFRYVAFQRLLEAETGFTKNEPVQLAMKNAIESAVEALIVEGVAKGLWTTKEGGLKNKQLMDAHKAQKEFEETRLLYDRKIIEPDKKDALIIGATTPLLNGDLPNQDFGFGGYIGYSKWLSPKLSLNFDFDYVYLTGGKSFFEEYLSPELNLELNILPYDKFGPFVYGGAGYIFEIHSPDGEQTKKVSTPKAQLGGGLNIRISDRIDFRVFGESNFTFSDKLDDVVHGKRDDFYYTFGAGVKYKLGKNKTNEELNDTK
ncbi:MAG: CsgG/HfaB family protein [Flavobacteriaceae bacterium]